MKLDRTVTAGARGKYSLILERKVAEANSPEVAAALAVLRDAGVLDESVVGDPGEFFVIRLRDKYAAAALMSYAFSAVPDDREYAEEVEAMARRAGASHPHCKRPD